MDSVGVCVRERKRVWEDTGGVGAGRRRVEMYEINM